MLWARYLCHRFSCDPRGLERQLCLPVLPGEAFVFGKWPVPNDSVGDIFQGTYHRGKNPDGKYFTEPDIPDQKFNLFRRVLERVPQSEHWLLADASPYFSGLPDIAKSTALSASLCKQLSVFMLDADEIAVWRQFDRLELGDAERISLGAVAALASPEALTLLLALTHLSVWHGRRVGKWSVVDNSLLTDRLIQASVACSEVISDLPWLRDGDQGAKLSQALLVSVQCAVALLPRFGFRGVSELHEADNFPIHIVLLPDTHENRGRAQELRAYRHRRPLYTFDLNDYSVAPPPNLFTLLDELRGEAEKI